MKMPEVTYGALANAVRSCAASLATLGIGRRSRVAMVLDRGYHQARAAREPPPGHRKSSSS